MEQIRLEELPKETLVMLVRMYAKNWMNLYGLWFQSVEDEYGREAVARLDLKNWEKMSVTEAKRIKDVLSFNEGGLDSILKTLTLTSWQLSSPLFEIEEESPERIIFYYSHCPVQEGRRKKGEAEFPCQPMMLTQLSKIAEVIEPRAVVRCLGCPPEPHPKGFWCKWELTLLK